MSRIELDNEGRLDLREGFTYRDFCELEGTYADTFKQALYKTKGKSNTQFAARLALAGATADQIAKFVSNVNTDRWDFYTKPTQYKTTQEQRAARKILKTIPNFWDTVKGKIMRTIANERIFKLAGVDLAKPLLVTKLDATLSQYYVDNASHSISNIIRCYSDIELMRYDSDCKRKLNLAMAFNALADVKFDRADDSIKSMMSATERMGRGNMPEYETYRQYEIDSFVHMDEEVVSKIRPDELLVDALNNDIGYMYQDGQPDYIKKRAIDYQCVVEGFYSVCKELGIVGIGNKNENARIYVTRAALQGIMKHVIKMAGTYRRLVKGGFTESVARATVLEEINNAIANRQGRPYVRFYARNDYPDTPPEEKEKTKKEKVSSHSTGGKRVVKTSLEGFGGGSIGGSNE